MQLQKLLTSNRIQRLSMLCVFIILALPLLSVPPLFHPADWGKSIVFRIVFSLLALLFITDYLFNNSSNLKGAIQLIKNQLLPKLAIALALIFLIATIFSIDPSFSFWGSPHRGDGSLGFIFFILFSLFLFLIVKQTSWKKLWFFSFIVASLVSLVAIFQKYRLFSNIFLSYDWQPVSTLGSSSFLALYLVLLTYMAFSFALKKRGKKSIPYLFFGLLFLFTINLSGSRSALLGLFIGFLFFTLFYKSKNRADKFWLSKVFWLKTAVVLVVVGGLVGIFLVKDNADFIKKVEDNKLFGSGTYRILLTAKGMFDSKSLVPDIRVLGWKIAWNATKDRPILGYGPENFSIAFDSHLDYPTNQFGEFGWWDRAHNFILEISTTAGIPALLIYLSLVFFLFLKLQKQKKADPDNYLIYHGIQTSIIAYLVTLFFSFDCTVTYLIFFFILGYCFSLFYKTPVVENSENRLKGDIKSWIFVVACILFAVFIWQYNIKPLLINKDINNAEFLLNNKDCQTAITLMDRDLSRHTIIDNFLRLKFVSIINTCAPHDNTAVGRINFIKKTITILREATKLRPTYTRTWSILGNAIFTLLQPSANLTTEETSKLVDEMTAAFEKANQLCPKCRDPYIGLTRSYIAKKDYQKANEMANICVQFHPKRYDCWFIKAVSEIYLDNRETAKKDIEIAVQNGYDPKDGRFLIEFLNAYIGISDKHATDRGYYLEILPIYEWLAYLYPDQFQYHASLAYVYRSLGRYADARKEALKLIDIDPKFKTSVEDFLNTLPY